MSFLILETASFFPTIAHVDTAGLTPVIRTSPIPKGRGQDQLIPQIQNLVGGIYQGLTAIVITTGPGSFTGLRGGFAAAKGFSFALDIPLYGIDLFDLTYHVQKNTYPNQPLLIALESGRTEVFACLYNNGRGTILNDNPEAIWASVPQGTQAMGSAAGVFPQKDPEKIPPALTAHDLATLCVNEQWRTQHLTVNPAPFYVRPPDISLPKGTA